jgi:hypothetical protein
MKMRRFANSRAPQMLLGCLISFCNTSSAAAESLDESTKEHACEAVDGHNFICGAQRPEDLARIPESRWLVFSGFENGAGLKLVDSRNRTMRLWYRGESSQITPDTSRFPACHSAPDVGAFNTQGLSLRTVGTAVHELYVVNHGGRESIEIFRIDSSADEPKLRWIGCVLMPEATAANSVATYTDGTILASVLTRSGRSITDFVRGEITGGVYQWQPGDTGFSLLPGTELPGNNGIETSPDDREFYVIAFGWRAVVIFSRQNTAQSLRRATAPGFMPDNIHWDGQRLILAGMQYDEPACGGVRKILDGKADDMRCHRGYAVAAFDPLSLQFTMIAYAEPNPAFNGVSAARIVEQELWLAAYQGDRIAVRSLPGLH